MKVTIQVNNQDVEIELTDEQVKQITDASKPKLFQYDEDYTYRIEANYILDKQVGNVTDFIKYGRYRRTKEQAEMDFKRQTRMMRLSALAWEVGKCVEFEEGKDKYFIFCDDGIWDYAYTNCIYPEVVLMTKDTAIKVCEMLNSGEYSLDVE